MKYWIARDRCGGYLHIFREKPRRMMKSGWWVLADFKEAFCLPSELFPELTWDDKPKLVELKLIDNHD